MKINYAYIQLCCKIFYFEKSRFFVIPMQYVSTLEKDFLLVLKVSYKTIKIGFCGLQLKFNTGSKNYRNPFQKVRREIFCFNDVSVFHYLKSLSECGGTLMNYFLCSKLLCSRKVT